MSFVYPPDVPSDRQAANLEGSARSCLIMAGLSVLLVVSRFLFSALCWGVR
jgi:hypothetical protein